MAKKTPWQRIREQYACKGRVRAERGGPSFCYRVRSEKTPAGKVHVVQLVSRRTGKPVGFISRDFTFVPDRAAAHEWDSLNRFSAETFMESAIDESKERRRQYAGSRALVRDIDRAARKAPKGH